MEEILKRFRRDFGKDSEYFFEEKGDFKRIFKRDFRTDFRRDCRTDFRREYKIFFMRF